VWHVATGFSTDIAGELGLEAFYAAQLPPVRLERGHMDFLLMIGVLVAWFALQRWILPRLGVAT
jgi:ubiquinone biosynthesis protein Coq4